MAEQSNRDRLREITDSIEQGIQELFASDRYAEYLRVMSRFHQYSVNNQILIYMQNPRATLVAGYTKWRDQFGRNVMKGEKGIKIIAPAPYTKKVEEERVDAQGNIVTEEKEIRVPMFRTATVFDISQTEGKPLPSLAADLTGDVQNYNVFMEALHRASPVSIEIKPIDTGADGFFSLTDQSITLKEGMSEVQTVCAAIHEIAHAKLHNRNEPIPPDAPIYQEVEILDTPALFSNGRIDSATIPEGLYRYELRGSDDDPDLPVMLQEHVLVNHAGSILTAKPLSIPEEGYIRLTEDSGLDYVGGEITAYEFRANQKKDRRTQEVEAESISYAVCAYYGIATGENSFGYIAHWSKDRSLQELRDSLETIHKTSSGLITDIDRSYAEIMEEREALQSQLTSKDEALYILNETTYLHIQRSSAGTWDYSLYDKATLDLQDGGAIDDHKMTIDQARAAILSEQGIQIYRIELVPIEEMKSTLDVLQSAAEAKAVPYLYPDPSISLATLAAYGYIDKGMLPLLRDRAKELYERDVPIYMLYEDNTEVMVLSPNELQSFKGYFGVTREDWSQVRHRIPMMTEETLQARCEQVFHESSTDSFAIYQLKNTDDVADLRFMGMDWLQKKGVVPEYDNYVPVYVAPLQQEGTQAEMLENIYQSFNTDYPEDYFGHSLSVSDVVALNQNGNVLFYYVDRTVFKELVNFHPAELNRDAKDRGELKGEKVSALERLRKLRDERADRVAEGHWRERNVL